MLLSNHLIIELHVIRFLENDFDIINCRNCETDRGGSEELFGWGAAAVCEFESSILGSEFKCSMDYQRRERPWRLSGLFSLSDLFLFIFKA